MTSPWVLLDGPQNLRDLGGIPAGAGEVRSGLVYRADSLVGLTQADIERLLGRGIRTVIDLRTAEEAATGVTELSDHGAAVHGLPIGRRLGSIRRRGSQSVSMAEGYLTMFEASLDNIRRALGLLADDGNLPAVFHCAGGKDRAGIMAASLLSVLGADTRAITTEYALTAEVFPSVIDRLRADAQYRDVMDRVDTDSLTAHPETMRGFLELVEQRYGSMAEALRLGDGVVKRLRSTLLIG